MKKLLLVFMIIALCFAMCACGEENKPNEINEANVETNVPIEEEEFQLRPADESVYQKFRVKYNGVEFGVKDKFDDVKEGLGEEIRPPQTYTPCAAAVEGEVTTHYYEGLTLEETDKGIIYTIKFTSQENPNSTAELVTGIKLGSTREDLINAYGDPDSNDEYNAVFNYENLYVGFSYDVDGDGNICYFSIESGV